MIRNSRWPLAVSFLIAGIIVGSYTTHRGSEAEAQQAPAQAPAPAELHSYRHIVKKVVPAVVSIDSKSRARRQRQKDENADKDRQPRQGVNLGFGSGFIADAKGVVVTCFHVIEGGDWVEVELPDGRKYISQDIRGDRKTDLAVIRIQPEKALPALELADSDLMEVGDRVLAVGAPFGLTGSVTHGIVSSKSRNLRLNQYEDFIQTDAAINPGNSGGPLVNMEGKVIGVSSAIKSRSGGFQGVGLAISSKLTRNIMERLLRDGVVRRGYIGVSVRDVKELDAEVLKKLGVTAEEGVVIARVFNESPAAKAGLKAGDVVLSIGGRQVRDGVELSRVVESLQLNTTAAVELIRSGERMQIKVPIGEQPDDFGPGLPKDDE
jgi:serine protease Do